MGTQKLSATALKAKRERDLEYANSPDREAKRAENQRRRRAAAKKHGENWLIDKDYDHSKKQFTSTKNNRGEYGKGTKS
tara:strand:- start:333 stop:569 length:237 start_codon:yes stop_codon:yes gene_type:complete